MKTINIIGAGRLGLHIGQALIAAGLARIIGICNSNQMSAKIALSQLPHGVACPSLHELPVADITFITCPDIAIGLVVKTLSEHSGFKDKIVVHCSGVLDSEILAPLRQNGALIASLHPLKAFTQQRNDAIFKHCFYVIDGDNHACDDLKSLFNALGAIDLKFKSRDKSRYHCAAVMASNYLVTLATASQSLFEQSGLLPDSAKKAVITLMEQSLANLKQCDDFSAALTGPLQRGDSSPIANHLQSLTDSPTLKALYQSAGLATIEYCHLNKTSHKQIYQILQTGLTDR